MSTIEDRIKVYRFKEDDLVIEPLNLEQKIKINIPEYTSSVEFRQNEHDLDTYCLLQKRSCSVII